MFVLLLSAARISLPELMVGVFLSTNNGASWTEANTGLKNTSVYALTVRALISLPEPMTEAFGGVHCDNQETQVQTVTNSRYYRLRIGANMINYVNNNVRTIPFVTANELFIVAIGTV